MHHYAQFNTERGYLFLSICVLINLNKSIKFNNIIFIPKLQSSYKFQQVKPLSFN